MQQVDLEKVAIGPRRLGHANLTVSDLDRSVAFYNRVCGLDITGVERAHGITAGFLSNGNTHHDIGLVQYPDRPAGLNHFGWEMENEQELVDAYHRIRKAGLTIERLTDQGTSRSIYLSDADGLSHQFYADSIKDWRTVYSGGSVVLHGRPTWTPGDPPPTTEPKYHTNPEIRRLASALAQPLRITRSVLFTSDLDRAVAFYTDVFGFDLGHRARGNGLATLHGKASTYDLALVAAPRSGLAGVCLEMANEADVEAAEESFKAAGVPVEASVDNDRKRSVFIRDPDGVPVEFCKDRDVAFPELGGEPDAWRLVA